MKAALPALLLFASLGASAAPPMRHAEGLSWLCAGVGADERRVLDELRPQTRLEVVLAAGKRGEYVSDAELALYAGSDRNPLVRTTADGPICLIDAPPGSYRIEARYGGVTRSVRTAIANAGGPPRKVVLTFPEEPWDGIRASPEEKAQAKEP